MAIEEYEQVAELLIEGIEDIIENINKIKLTKAFETKSTSKSTKKTDKKVK